MSQCTTDENKTQYFSIFWGIFNLCVIPGNVASHFILQSGTSHHGNTTTTPAPDPLKQMVTGWEAPNSILFIVLTIAGAVGVLLFSLIVTPDSRYGTKPTEETRPVSTQVKATFMLMFRSEMVSLPLSPSPPYQSAINRLSIGYQLAINWLSIGHQSAINQPSIGHQSAINRPSTGHQPAWHGP
jgi:hypothetical protein